MDNEKLNISDLMKDTLQDKVMGIFGKSGSGKSTAIKKILNSNVINKNKKLVYISPVATPNDLYDFKYKANNVDDIMKYFDKIQNSESILINVASEKILQLVLMQCMIRQNCTIFADDLDGYLSKNNSRILHLLTYHRHKKLSLVYVTRRPQSLPNLLITNTHTALVFKFTDPVTLDVVSKNFPNDTGNTKDIISNLDYNKHECYIYSQGFNQVGGF
jgi:DNA helicase HerA-like ATPase